MQYHLFVLIKSQPVLDGNVFRIISRVYEIKNPIDLNKSRKVFKEKAKEMMPSDRYGDYNQALMDFGSIICKPLNPFVHLVLFQKFVLLSIIILWNIIRLRALKVRLCCCILMT